MTGFDDQAQRPRESWTQTALELLAAGLPEDEVVERLVAQGLPASRAAAIVQLMAGRRVRLSSRAAHKDMWQGSLWLVLGTILTAGSYYFSTPGNGFVLAWGAIIFGGLQYLRGWRRAGRPGSGLALRLLFSSAALLLLLFAASLGLPNLTRAYRDDQQGFELRYPWTYAVETVDEPDGQQLNFVPRYGWGNERRSLEVTIDTSGHMQGWKQNSLVAVLRASVLTQDDTLVKGTWPTSIDSRPAAEISFHVYPQAPEERYAAWLALLNTPQASFWLAAYEANGTSDRLEPFYRKFVASFHNDSPREAALAAVAGSACGDGWARFDDAELGFGVCHPATWLAVPVWNEVNGGQGLHFFSPTSQEEEGLIAVLVYPQLGQARHWGDTEWAQQLLDGMADEGVTVDREPQITILGDFRILESGWRAEDEVGGQLTDVVTRVAWIVHDDGAWWLEAAGQAQHAGDLERTYDQFLSTFEIAYAAP